MKKNTTSLFIDFFSNSFGLDKEGGIEAVLDFLSKSCCLFSLLISVFLSWGCFFSFWVEPFGEDLLLPGVKPGIFMPSGRVFDTRNALARRKLGVDRLDLRSFNLSMVRGSVRDFSTWKLKKKKYWKIKNILRVDKGEMQKPLNNFLD